MMIPTISTICMMIGYVCTTGYESVILDTIHTDIDTYSSILDIYDNRVVRDDSVVYNDMVQSTYGYSSRIVYNSTAYNGMYNYSVYNDSHAYICVEYTSYVNHANHTSNHILLILHRYDIYISDDRGYTYDSVRIDGDYRIVMDRSSTHI